MPVISPENWDNISGTGKSMNELGDAWWIRALEISNDENAFIFEDSTDSRGRLGSSEKARINQSEPIFFLGGTFVSDEDVTGGELPTFTPERSIVVPNDAVLVFPLINSAAPSAVKNPPGPEDEGAARDEVNSNFNDPSLFTATVIVDGTPVSSIGPVSSPRNDGDSLNGDGFRRESSPGGFEYTIPPNNISDIITGEDFPAQTIKKAVSDGYWYAFDISDLGPGSHTLNFDASIDVDADNNSDFRLNVTYNLLNPIIGTDEKDTLTGTPKNDYIDGGKGKDFLSGKAGDDLILGGKSRDIIDGGIGDDELWGDNDKDTFIYKKGYGEDTIFDFQVGEVVEIAGFKSFEILDILLDSGLNAAEIKFNNDDDTTLTFVGVQSNDLFIDLDNKTITFV